jgi:predicted permease
MVGVTEGETTRRCFGALVSANYFKTFGVQLAGGREFLPEDERPGSAVPVVIVSHNYWKRTGADPAMVGRMVRINSRTFQVVGIAPEFFTGTTSVFSPDFWLPLGMYEAVVNDFMNERKQRLDDRSNHGLMLVGRLKPGMTMSQAQAQLQSLASQLETAYPDANKDHTIELGELSRISISTNPQRHSSTTTLSVLLMAMSGAVLLIACLNLANLLLARGAARRREIAIRMSLGGSRGRIVRQLLTEGLLLSLLGGWCGLMLACWATNLLVASLAPKLPFMVIVFDPTPDLRVLAATLGACLLSTMLFGLGPAWKLSRGDVASDLKEQVSYDLHGKASPSVLAPRSLLVVGQIALSLALLTGAGLFMRGAINAASANPGFSLDHSLLVETDASLADYGETQGRQIYLNLLEQLRALPGVQAASLAYIVPFGLFLDIQSVQKAGTAPSLSSEKDSASKEQSVGASFNIVATDYFKTLGLPLLRGREFDRLEVESTSAPPVAVIDEPLANKLWPGENPVGRQIQFGKGNEGDKPKVMEIVGVVAGVRDNFSDKAPQPHVYVPLGQKYRAGMNLHLKLGTLNRQAEAAMLKTVHETIRAVDSRLPVISVQTLRRFHDEGLMLWFVRTGARLFAIFGALALFLAVVGVYGVKAYVVARRTREIGIRMALGATTRDVLWIVLRDGLKMTLLGLAVGLLLAVCVGLLLRSMLYEVQALDPVTFLTVPLFLAAAAMLACYLPARRAARVDPVVALRYE